MAQQQINTAFSKTRDRGELIFGVRRNKPAGAEHPDALADADAFIPLTVDADGYLRTAAKGEVWNGRQTQFVQDQMSRQVLELILVELQEIKELLAR